MAAPCATWHCFGLERSARVAAARAPQRSCRSVKGTCSAAPAACGSCLSHSSSQLAVNTLLHMCQKNKTKQKQNDLFLHLTQTTGRHTHWALTQLEPFGAGRCSGSGSDRLWKTHRQAWRHTTSRSASQIVWTPVWHCGSGASAGATLRYAGACQQCHCGKAVSKEGRSSLTQLLSHVGPLAGAGASPAAERGRDVWCRVAYKTPGCEDTRIS